LSSIRDWPCWLERVIKQESNQAPIGDKYTVSQTLNINLQYAKNPIVWHNIELQFPATMYHTQTPKSINTPYMSESRLGVVTSALAGASLPKRLFKSWADPLGPKYVKLPQANSHLCPPPWSSRGLH
jgi:hypothetical protein